MEARDNDNYPCHDPTIELVWQERSVPQLTYVSWPDTDPRTGFLDLQHRYYFDDSAASDIDVWVMDTGASAGHPVRMIAPPNFDER